jgi:hypothetical protein
MALNVFLPVVKGWKKGDMEGIEKWFHIYPLAYGKNMLIMLKRPSVFMLYSFSSL